MYINTSPEALRALAVDLDTIGPDHVMKAPTHRSASVLLRSADTLRAVADEKDAAAVKEAEIIERCAKAMDAKAEAHLRSSSGHSEGLLGQSAANYDAMRARDYEFAASAIRALKGGA